MSDEKERWTLRVYGPAKNVLWARDYEAHVSANRAIPSVRKTHPGTYGEVSRYVLRLGPFPHWSCGGVRGVDVFVAWDDRAGKKRGVVAP